MTDRLDGGLLDLIYGAAVDPTLWSTALEAYADRLGGTSAWLSQLSIEDGSGGNLNDPMARIDPLWPRRYAEHFADRNPLHQVDDPTGYLRQWKPIVLTDEDWMPKAELIKSEFYNDFLKPQDVGSTVMIRLAARGADIAVLNINRSLRAERFSPADKRLAARFQPHMIRSFGLSQKLNATLRLTGELASVLDLSPYGLILLDSKGRVRHVNRTAESLMREPGGLTVSGGRLSARLPEAARRLGALIQAAASQDVGYCSGGSMALATSGRRLPLSLTVAPIRSRRLFSLNEGPSVLICVTDLEARVSLPEQRLRGLFGLTGAETRLALAIFEGATPREAAATLGISANTAKVHLNHVFEKTGVNRQSELVGLMMRAIGVHLD